MAGFERGDYAELSALHRDIYEKFTYISDKEKWAMLERWEDSSTLRNIGRSGVAKFEGDCEEFALVSLDNLRRKGYNARLVVCLVETGQGHAICEVASQDYEQAYYFDNRHVGIRTRAELKGYRFLSVSPWNPEPGDTRPWLRVGNPTT